MKERVKVMQDVYENRSTNKKAAGCTVIISGEMKDRKSTRLNSSHD